MEARRSSADAGSTRSFLVRRIAKQSPIRRLVFGCRGFDSALYLVRFRGRATGNIIVTVRLKDVEQVFCTDQTGGSLAFANLTDSSPAFVPVSQSHVETLNSLVAAMIR
jgi:hypothetical protein